MRRSIAGVLIAVLTATALTFVDHPAAAAQSPADAVNTAAANAAANGVTSFISVVDRTTGAVQGQTGNAGTQVASESIMKLFLASYYLLLYGGYASTPQSVRDRLQFMLMYSDDGTASALFTDAAIPTVAARYGLDATINATDRAGHWGAARITANDMTRFLFRSSQDPQVGPWLIPVMAQTAPTGSGADAGFSQYFGLNALTGEHGSKQGWGCDSFWTSPQCAIHSVGYTDRYFVAVLQLSNGYPDPMRPTATRSAQLIQQAGGAPTDGEFIADSATGYVYRIAGGAPVFVSDWALFGGVQPVRWMSTYEISLLPRYPVDGTFLRDVSNGTIYRVAGGAPVWVSTLAPFPGAAPINIDPAAITYAGQGTVWDHLRWFPADGTFLRGSNDGAVFRVAGGAPVYVAGWTAFGGQQPLTDVDSTALNRAGGPGELAHLNYFPADGTLLRGMASGDVYTVAGGAPVYVSTWDAVGGVQQTVGVDDAATDAAGAGGPYNHLRYRPADGTFLAGGRTGAVYTIAGGAPVYVSSWPAFGGRQSTVFVDEAALDRAGSGGPFVHLAYRPADGTFVRATGSGAVYRMAGGAPLYVSGWNAFGGPQPATTVDARAIGSAASGWPYDHLLFYPAEGTFLRGTRTGSVFRVAGGAPLYVTGWADLGGPQVAVDIDENVADKAGSGGYFDHLRFWPVDGTFLLGLPAGPVFRVANKVAGYVPSWDPYGGVQPTVAINQLTLERAGGGGVYNHLAR